MSLRTRWRETLTMTALESSNAALEAIPVPYVTADEAYALLRTDRELDLEKIQ